MFARDLIIKDLSMLPQSKGPQGPVGLVAHCAKPNAAELLRQLAAKLRACGAEVLLESESAALAGEPGGVSYDELGRRCVLLLVLGGDGTILKAVYELGERLRPILGINIGSLGFLTCISSGNAMDAVEAVCTGRYVLSRRSLLDVMLERKGEIIYRRNGLNEAVLSRGGLSRLIKLDTWVNGIALTQYNADGLLVATPTGSTAYSLSAGGPVIAPDARVFVVTPVCPHVLTNRSLVVSDGAEIVVRPVGGQTDVLLTVDGHGVENVFEGDLIRIRKSTLQFSLAMLPELSFCEVLREKLKWSGSAV